MARVIADRVKETTTTTGTGTYALAGAVSGFQAFSAVCANNDVAYYCAENGVDWEVGYGTWTTGNNLARTTIIASSNANAAVNWSAGSKNVFLTHAAKNIQPSTTVKTVAPTGADYTTLGAAIAAASNGWTIMVLDSVTETGAITSSLTKLTIIGTHPEQTRITSAGAITLSGTNVRLEGISIYLNGFNFTLSGAYAELIGCHLLRDAGGGTLFLNGDYAIMDNCRYISSLQGQTLSTSAGSNGFKQIINNYFEIKAGSSTTFTFNDSYVTFSNNVVNVNAGATSLQKILSFGGVGAEIIGNSFINSVGSTFAGAVQVTVAQSRVVGNKFDGLIGCLDMAGNSHEIVGNHFVSGGASANVISFSSTVQYSIIADNYIEASVGTQVGIKVVSGTFKYCTISGNVFGNATVTAIDLSGGTTVDYNNITGNNFADSTTNIVDKGNTTQILDNYGLSAPKNRRLISMKNNSGGALAAGDVVILDTSVAAGDNVTTTTTASDNKIFGMAEEAISAGAYGMILVEGKTVNLKANGTTAIAVGDFLTTYTAAKIAAKAVATNLAFAYALEAYSTADSNGVLDALLIPARKL